jgi:chemotaxis protein MotB
MSDDSQRPIIVKRIKKAAHGHHGGAWKIAYADFVTAMMAFFLLMWLLGSTAKGDLAGISEYFKTPLKVAMSGGSGSGDSSSVIKGGGKDMTRKEGQVHKTVDPIEQKKANLQAAKAEFEKQERKKLHELKDRLEKAIEINPLLNQFKQQILIDITSEGLRIQIVDEKNRPMFDLGGAHMKSYTTQILHEIGKMLNEVPNKISLSGHTDAKPYSSGEKGYSNWELSADRANSSAVMLDNNDPYNPINRRISLIVLNKETEEAITRGGKPLEVTHQDQAAAVLDGAPKLVPKEVSHAVAAEGKPKP